MESKSRPKFTLDAEEFEPIDEEEVTQVSNQLQSSAASGVYARDNRLTLGHSSYSSEQRTQTSNPSRRPSYTQEYPPNHKSLDHRNSVRRYSLQDTRTPPPSASSTGSMTLYHHPMRVSQLAVHSRRSVHMGKNSLRGVSSFAGNTYLTRYDLHQTLYTCINDKRRGCL